MSEFHIPLREYMANEETARREWMVATFATKDDLALVRQDVAIIKDRNDRETKRAVAAWGSAGTLLGGVVVAVLAYFGIRPQQ